MTYEEYLGHLRAAEKLQRLVAEYPEVAQYMEWLKKFLASRPEMGYTHVRRRWSSSPKRPTPPRPYTEG